MTGQGCDRILRICCRPEIIIECFRGRHRGGAILLNFYGSPDPFSCSEMSLFSLETCTPVKATPWSTPWDQAISFTFWGDFLTNISQRTWIKRKNTQKTNTTHCIEFTKHPVESHWHPEIASFCPLSWSSLSWKGMLPKSQENLFLIALGIENSRIHLVRHCADFPEKLLGHSSWTYPSGSDPLQTLHPLSWFGLPLTRNLDNQVQKFQVRLKIVSIFGPSGLGWVFDVGPSHFRIKLPTNNWKFLSKFFG